MLCFPEVIECPDKGRIVGGADPGGFQLKPLLFKEIAGIFAARLEEQFIRRSLLHNRSVNHTAGIVRSESWFTTVGLLAPHPGGGKWGGDTLDGEKFSVRALPPRTDMIHLQIVEGRDLLPGDVDAIVVNTALVATSPEMKVGSHVSFRLGPRLTWWHVVGITYRFFYFPPTAYIPQAFADQFRPGMRTSAFLVLAKTHAASVNWVKANLERSIQTGEYPHFGAPTSKAELRHGRYEHMLMIYVFLMVMSGIILVVGGLGPATTERLNVMERRREMGRDSRNWRNIGDGLAHHCLGGCGGGSAELGPCRACCLAGQAVAGRCTGKGGIPHQPDLVVSIEGLFIWIGVSILLAAVASFLPAWSASQITVREALAYE